MELKKSPLIEIWMSFRFDPGESPGKWDGARFNKLWKTLKDEYPNRQELRQQSIRVGTKKKSGDPVFKGFLDEIIAQRVISENELRVVQLRPDELIVNYVKGATEPYPGFESLLDVAAARCQSYFECYQPAGIVQTALHYVDIVEIPIESGQIRTGDYFTFDVRAPDSWTFGTFRLQTTLCPADSKEIIEVVFATEPGKTESGNARFRLEWHIASKSEDRMTIEQAKAALSNFHASLGKCFRQAFTEKGWALFEPQS